MSLTIADQTPRRAVLLSAGQGRRLLPFTSDRPKCLLELEGRSVIERQIDNLRAGGIRHIAVVAGYGIEQVEQRLRQRYGAGAIEIVFNPFYEVADNLASCWMAREALQGELILLNGDTLFDLPLLQRLLAAPPHPITLAVDHKRDYDADDMKVTLDGERLLRVGKALPSAEVHGESIGMLRFLPAGAQRFREALERAMHTPEGLRQWYLSVVDTLARTTGEVFARSIEGVGWCELDYPKDLEDARRLVRTWDDAWAEPAHG